MAQADELIYTVKFEVDGASYQSIAQAIRDIGQSMGQITQGGEIVQTMEQVAQATEDAARASQDLAQESERSMASTMAFDKAALASTKSLADLTRQIQANKKEIKERRDLAKETGEIDQQSAERIEALLVQNKELGREYNRQQREVSILNSELFETANTYRELEEQNRALALTMKQIPLDDTSGQLQALQKQYDSNNQKLKDFDASLGNHQRNVGNYGSVWEEVGGTFKKTIGGMNPLLGSLVSGLGASTAGVQGLKTALITSGIGALVVAIGTAFATLTSAMNEFQPVIDAVNRITSQLSAGFSSLAHNAAVFFGILDEEYVSITDNIKAAGELSNAQVRLEKAEIALIKTRADLRAQSAQARLEAQDETKSVQDRQRALEQAIRAEEQLGQQQEAVAEMRYLLLQEENKLTHSNREAVRAENEAYAEYIRTQEEAAMRMRELYGTRKTLADMAAREIAETLSLADVLARIRGEQLTAEAEREAQRLEEIGKFVEAADIRLAQRRLQIQQQYIDEGLSAEEAGIAASEALRVQAMHEREDAYAAEAQFAFDLAAAQVEARMYSAQLITQIANQLFGDNKAIAIAAATVETYTNAAITYASVMATTLGNVALAKLAAATVIAGGLATIKKIVGTEPGDSPDKGAPGGAGGGGSSQQRTFTGIKFVQDDDDIVGAQRILAGSVGARSGPQDRDVYVSATVDQRGVAVAVREGEKQIQSQQFSYS
jgi:hypothetical protein